MNLDSLADALNATVSIDETHKEVKSLNDNVDESSILGVAEDNIIDTLLTAKEDTTQTQVVDTINYDCDLPHVTFETVSLLKVLSQVTTVLDTNSKRAVSRGITLVPVDSTHIDIISPNELYYFKTTLEVENTLPEGTTIFIEYMFIQKIARFLGSKVLIYLVADEKTSKYYIRLKTGDLELLNTRLIDQDLKLLTPEYEITDKLIKEMNLSSLNNSLSTLSRIVNFESDAPRKLLSTKEGLSTFKSALVYAGSKTELPDITLKPKEMDYLMKAATLAGKDESIKVYETTSQLTRYAFTYGTTTMVTNYATPKDDVRVKELLNNLPDLTTIDYQDLKFNLDYANSITYALGLVTLYNEEGSLKAKIKLQNGTETPVDITTYDAITIEPGKNIKVNTKTLLQALNALNPSLPTQLGVKDGLLYIVNSDITLVLVTI